MPAGQSAAQTEQISGDFIQQLAGYLDAGDYEGALDLCEGMDYPIIPESLVYPMSNGKSMVFYGLLYGRQFRGIYYGSYEDGNRVGEGIWICGGYCCIGPWSGDKPNGEWQCIPTLRTYTYSCSGNVVDGLWDGTVTISDSYGICMGTCNMGIWDIIKELIDYPAENEISYVYAEGERHRHSVADESMLRDTSGIPGFCDQATW